jgi:hypothetical protein
VKPTPLLMMPRSMHDANVRQQRKGMLDQPHIAKLTDYVAELRGCSGLEVPDFDPLDGGIEAQALFLFEKPGPMTTESGFISRDNDDPTAEATFRFMEQAGIPRKCTVIWNVVPWWNGTRRVTAGELRGGVACVEALIKLLPALSAVVMVGGKAARAKHSLESTGLVLVGSCHPSPIVRATSPAKWEAIPGQWAKVMAVLAIAERRSGQ